MSVTAFARVRLCLGAGPTFGNLCYCFMCDRGSAAGAAISLLDHDNVFWFGDLNYRINLSDAEARASVDAGRLEYLLAHDQLKVKIYTFFYDSVCFLSFGACVRGGCVCGRCFCFYMCSLCLCA